MSMAVFGSDLLMLHSNIWYGFIECPGQYLVQTYWCLITIFGMNFHEKSNTSKTKQIKSLPLAQSTSGFPNAASNFLTKIKYCFSPILNNLNAFSLTAHLLTNGGQFVNKMLQTEKEIFTLTSLKIELPSHSQAHLTRYEGCDGIHASSNTVYWCG